MSTHVEEWRVIPGHPDYEVSDLGRVRRATPGVGTKPGRLRTQHVDAPGYPSLVLPAAKGRVRVRTHVLVAAAFLGPRPDRDQIDHINGIKTDNRACNLEYVPQAENIKRAHAMGLKGGRPKGAPATARQLARAPRGDRNGRHTHPERTARGERNGHSKLTESIVLEIRRRRAAGESVLSLSREFGIDPGAGSRIARGKSWAHVGVQP